MDKTQRAKEDGGRESDGAELLVEEREGEVEQQQQGKYTSVNGRDIELPAATTDAIASGLRQTEQVHAKDREEEDDEDMSGAVTGTTVAAIVLLLGIVGIFDAVGFLYREQINDILTQFSDFLKGTYLLLLLPCKYSSHYSFFMILYSKDEVSLWKQENLWYASQGTS